MTFTMMNQWIDSFITHLLHWSTTLLMPLMLVVFAVAIVARLVVYVILKSENRFTLEFEKGKFKALQGGQTPLV